MKSDNELSELENILHHLNYRWNIEALALWKGDKALFEPYRIYEGFDDFLSLNTLSRIEKLEKTESKNRLKHALIDHYLQKSLLPHENEMRTWMRGAAAHVNGEKIYISNGAWADVFVVYAKIDGEKFTGFIIERDFPGVSHGAEEKKMGIKGSSTTSVVGS